MVINPTVGSMEKWKSLVKETPFWRFYDGYTRAETCQETIQRYDKRLIKLNTNEGNILLIPHPFEENWWMPSSSFKYLGDAQLGENYVPAWTIEDKRKSQKIIIWEGNVFYQ